jgi:hypothetical protein
VVGKKSDKLFISDDDVAKLDSSQPKQFVSDEDVSKIDAQNEPKQYSQSEALGLLAPRTATFGLAPAASGVGAGLGAASVAPWGKKIDAYTNAYFEGKDERLNAQNEAAKQYPKTALASDVGGMLATAPLMAAQSVPAAIGKGAASGAAYGIGEGKDLKDVGDGALVGGGTAGLLQGASPYASKLAGAVGRGGAKAIGSLTGLPEEQILNYAQKTPLINQLIKETGNDYAGAVEKQRQGLLGDVSSFRKSANANIGNVLKNSNEGMAPGQVLNELQAAKAQLDPVLQKQKISALDDLINTYSSAVNEKGQITPNQMNILRGELQGIASSGNAYMSPSTGQLMPQSTQVGLAAKNAGRLASESLKNQFPEIKQGFNDLSSLHNIEGKIGGLLGENTNSNTLMNAAGSDSLKGSRLRYLSDKVGSPAVGNLQNLKTAQTFSNPDMISQFKTGRSLTGMALGAGAGALIDPNDRRTGAEIGAVVASPMGVKGLINAINLAKKLPADKARGLLTNFINEQQYQKSQ